jgi:hypothetical protein
MAGKRGETAPKRSIIKRIFGVLFLVAVGIGCFWAYHNAEALKTLALPSDHDETIETLETVCLADEILAKQTRLLPSKHHSFGPVTLFFSPHLLIQSKYSVDGRSSQSASMLWDLTDGELVLDTNTFEHTQGFADCLVSQPNADDFRILHLLARSGPLSKETVIHELGGNDETLCERIEGLRKRHMVIVSNDIVRLHVESPLLKIDPVTVMTRPFVHRHTVRSTLIEAKYSRHDLENLVKAAFGSNLAIRTSRVIYIPTYEIVVNNPDGSVRKTYWNAVCGREAWSGARPPLVP